MTAKPKFRRARGSDANRSSLQGYLRGVDYQDLCEVFGPHHEESDDGKVAAEWIIKFAGGKVATIYDWKSDCGLGDVVEWHIGGHGPAVLDLVAAVVGGLGTVVSREGRG
jgi:hypothetical protein